MMSQRCVAGPVHCSMKGLECTRLERTQTQGTPKHQARPSRSRRLLVLALSGSRRSFEAVGREEIGHLMLVQNFYDDTLEYFTVDFLTVSHSLQCTCFSQLPRCPMGSSRDLIFMDCPGNLFFSLPSWELLPLLFSSGEPSSW